VQGVRDSCAGTGVSFIQAAHIDPPIAGLLEDLKRRGMLDETLVGWTRKFGRTPARTLPTAGAIKEPVFRPGWRGGA
jgi:hypothetical protein